MAREGRPIVIFPQGTRVDPMASPADKPYRNGVARMAAATGLPVIPLALNSGLFWPRKGWLKYSGKVVFEFLPPVVAPPASDEFMTELQERLEAASAALAQEGAETYRVPL